MEETPTPFDHSASPCDLTAVLRRVVTGDQSALADFYDATRQLVYSLAVRIVAEPATAEDIVVEVYTRVWEQARMYDPRRGTPLAWLLMVTRSRAIDFVRSRRRVHTEQPIEAAEQIQSLLLDPEEQSVATERYRIVRRALDSLDIDQR